MPRCGIRFPTRLRDPHDEHGCVYPSGHTGPHVFVGEDGKTLYEWTLDLDCDCEDCQSDEPDDWCLIYGVK